MINFSSFFKSGVIASILITGLAVAAPAHAAKTVSLTCDKTLTNPDASACTIYSKNLLGGDKTKIAQQKAAVAALPGDFVFDGKWTDTDPTFKITGLSKAGDLDFGKMLYGTTIIGAHFGNVAGDAKNVTVFWLLDLGTTGARSIALDNTQGFSNAVLYTTGVGAVPEPATWLMMIIGFGGIGFSMRRKRPAKRLQFA